MTRATRTEWLLFLALGFMWGSSYLFIKIAVQHLTPVSLVFARALVASALLVPVAAARGQLRPLLKRWRPMLAYTAAGLAIPWVFLGNAEKRLTSSMTGLLLAAVPLVGALLGWLTKTDRLDWRRGLGLLIGLAGMRLGFGGVTFQARAFAAIDGVIHAPCLSSFLYALAVLLVTLALLIPLHRRGIHLRL